MSKVLLIDILTFIVVNLWWNICNSVNVVSLGGSRKISVVHYVDDSELPKISRQMVWRAAVERSKNASQLALQVCFDFYTLQK